MVNTRYIELTDIDLKTGQHRKLLLVINTNQIVEIGLLICRVKCVSSFSDQRFIFFFYLLFNAWDIFFNLVFHLTFSHSR